MGPIVGALLTGGLSLLGNAVMSKGLKWLEEKTGIDLSGDDLTEEQLAKLKQFEMDHEEELIKLKQEDNRILAEYEKMYLQDTQDARSMQKVALVQDDKFVKRFIYYFAIFWAVVAIGYIVAITFINIPEDNIRFADTILGFLLGTIVSQIIAFFYGSSKSSQNKDDVIKAVVERANQ